MSDKGVKYDGEKPQMYLLPPLAALEVGKVLTYGAKKYSPDNWRKVNGLQERYTSATLRHLLAHMAGEEKDEETDLDHLAHAITCLMFKLEDRLMAEKAEPEKMEDASMPSSKKGFDAGPYEGTWFVPRGVKKHEP